MKSTIFNFQLIVGTKENAGPEFEDPTHSGCRRYQQPLQTSRLPARQIIAEKGTKDTAFRLIAKQWQPKNKNQNPISTPLSGRKCLKIPVNIGFLKIAHRG